MTSTTDWVHYVLDKDVERRVGSSTFSRGRWYALQGRVRSLTHSPSGAILATVRGTRPTPYEVVVTGRRNHTGVWWDGECTCPVGFECKHAVAALIAARLALRPVQTSWEEVLGPLVREPEHAGPSSSTVPLALHFLVEQPRPGRYSSGVTVPRVTLRPMLRGKSGRWVKTGASWADLGTGYTRGPSQAQLGVIQALWQIATAGRGGYLQYSRPDRLALADFPPGVWRVLESASQTGLALLSDLDPDTPVELAPDPATFAIDVVDAGDGSGGARVVPSVSVAGIRRRATEVGWLGDPVHGFFLESRPAGGPGGVVGSGRTSGRTSARNLTLTRLTEPLDRDVSTLVRRSVEIAIPGADVGRFMSLYYPRMRRRVAVESSDASVALPQIVPPRLALDVTFSSGHVADLRWSFLYGDAETAARLPFRPEPPGEPPGSMPVARDEGAERQIVDALDCLDALPVLATVHGGQRRMAEQARLAGHDTRVFVTEVLPRLEADERVVVSAQGEPADYRFADDAPVIAVSAHEAAEPGANDWFDLGVTVSVAGEDVPFQTLFTALARDEDHLILDSGTWFRLDREEFATLRRLIVEARSLQDRPGQTLRITPYQAGLWEELVELGVVASQSERWERTVTGLLSREEMPTPDLPAGMTATLRPYQVEGYHWLTQIWDLRLGGILADDMGLGKTLQMLALAQRAMEAGELTEPVLIVAPTSVLGTWVSEAARFTPDLPVVVLSETTKRRGGRLRDAIAGAALVVTSYAIFRIDEEHFQGERWRALVLDEAQFVKNHQAKTYQCARRLEAPVKLAITGTPLENSLMDLWALLSIVAPGVFPSPQRFGEIYRRPIEAGGAPEVLASLRRRIRPLMLRRTKELVASELPPKQEQVLHIALAPGHRRTYDQHLQRERQRVLGLIEDDFNANRIAILKSLTTLRLMALHPKLADPAYSANVASAKVEALIEQLREVASEGHRALVFSQFTRFLAMIRERLDAEGITYSYLDGRTRDRAARIEGFRSGTDPVFLISLKAGGFGLTLTEADYVFVMDPWWNPAAETQAIDRTHRIGQDKTVMVYRLVAKDTIEEKVLALQQRKRDLFAVVVEEGALTSGVLGADDIRALLAAPG